MLFDSVNNLCLTSPFWACDTMCCLIDLNVRSLRIRRVVRAPKSRQQWATETDVLSEIHWDRQCQCDRERDREREAREMPVIEWLRKCIVYVYVSMSACVSVYVCASMWQLLLLTFFDCASVKVLVHVLFSSLILSISAVAFLRHFPKLPTQLLN